MQKQFVVCCRRPKKLILAGINFRGGVSANTPCLGIMQRVGVRTERVNISIFVHFSSHEKHPATKFFTFTVQSNRLPCTFSKNGKIQSGYKSNNYLNNYWVACSSIACSKYLILDATKCIFFSDSANMLVTTFCSCTVTLWLLQHFKDWCTISILKTHVEWIVKVGGAPQNSNKRPSIEHDWSKVPVAYNKRGHVTTKS